MGSCSVSVCKLTCLQVMAIKLYRWGEDCNSWESSVRAHTNTRTHKTLNPNYICRRARAREHTRTHRHPLVVGDGIQNHLLQVMYIPVHLCSLYQRRAPTKLSPRSTHTLVPPVQGAGICPPVRKTDVARHPLQYHPVVARPSHHTPHIHVCVCVCVCVCVWLHWSARNCMVCASCRASFFLSSFMEGGGSEREERGRERACVYS